MIRIKKGLSLPILGGPKDDKIEEAKKVTSVGLTGPDYQGMKPTMLVKEGDEVKIGQPLFECKKQVGVVYTSPAAGKVASINRGAKRAFQTMVIQVSGSEDQVEFKNYKSMGPDAHTFESVKSLLLESGLWASLRTRPYSKNPSSDADRPAAVFITAIDTNPLTINPKLVIQEHAEDFKVGVEIVSKLSEGKTYLCREEGSGIEGSGSGNIIVSDFSGIHPAGNVGTHIHFLEPVHQTKTVWHLNYQDVIAIGKLFSTGKFWTERYIALGGPQVNNPRLLKTRLGANIMEIIHDGEIKGSESRVISGSVFNGRVLKGAFSFLGRYNTQVTVIKEGREREFLGWHAPGSNKFSVINTFVSKLSPGKLFNLTSSTNGSPRAMVPIGMFERVMPLDIEPVPLLKALLTQNTDYAQQLGCLELDEEDLALCTFVDSGKVDYGPALRESLTIIEKEG